jgi:hypothetical protein
MNLSKKLRMLLNKKNGAWHDAQQNRALICNYEKGQGLIILGLFHKLCFLYSEISLNSSPSLRSAVSIFSICAGLGFDRPAA